MKCRHPLWSAGAGIVLAGALLSGCGSSSSPTPVAGGPTTVADAPDSSLGLPASMRTKRYCEVLLVDLTGGDANAAVFNTFPINECPAEVWATLDPKAIATREGVPLAVLNGPRYWLMDRIENGGGPDDVRKDFGGMEMIQRASLAIGPLAEATKPYTTHNVNRSTVFAFDAGQTVYELTTADGTAYVMQSWSQQVDPNLSESDLAGLGARLQLPAGWTYRSRVLDAPLRVVTETTDAKVLQDDLKNSYSQETAP